MTDINSAADVPIPTADPVYVPKSRKRLRRTKATIAGIRTAIIDILTEDNPQTVRQVFYALTVRGKIVKDEAEYHRTVVRLLGELREAGTIPFEWIADNTRWQRKPTTFVGLELASTTPRSSTAATCGRRCRSTWRCGARKTHWPAC
jgi:hypothetical protein